MSKRYRNQRVLIDATLRLGPRQKGALVGANGVGKSTLLRLIAGVERPNAGSVNMPSDALVGYLPQEVRLREEAETVDGYLRRVAGIEEAQRRLESLAADLGSAERLAEYGEIQTRFETLGGWDFERRTDMVLAGFGLQPEDARRPLGELSGGQRSKVALGGILLKGLDVLLLDEPGNNLDLPALLWLERFLVESTATILMVSHDRRLIDRVASRVFELDWQTREITAYGGGYSDFLALKEKELRRQKELYRRQREEIGRLTDSVHQNRAWAAQGAVQQGSDHDKMGRDFSRERSAGLARRGRSIEKRLAQMDLVDEPPERQPLELLSLARGEAPPVPAGAPGADSTGDGDRDAAPGIRLEAVVAGYGGEFRLGPLDLWAGLGMRVAIVGANGSGKSTLLKVLTGQLAPLAGTVAIAPGLRFGNLMQAQEDLPRAHTPLWFLQARANLREDEAAGLLRAFQIERLDARKPIGELSPGIRARLVLASFSALRVNALALDEPTNHLDLETILALEEGLAGFAGLTLIVSHDREFLERITPSHAWLVRNGQVDAIPGVAAYAADMAGHRPRLGGKLISAS